MATPAASQILGLPCGAFRYENSTTTQERYSRVRVPPHPTCTNDVVALNWKPKRAGTVSFLSRAAYPNPEQYLTWGGRIIAPKDVYILLTRTYGRVALPGQRDIAGVLKLRC